MSSDAQITANRENGKLGGVKTDEGKATSRFNARKHGILSQQMTAYEGDIYQPILDQLYAEYDPQTLQEEMAVRCIATCYVQLHRAWKAEGEFMQMRVSMPRLNGGDMGYDPQVSATDMEKLGIYQRYVTSTENRIYRAVHELERLQALRKEREASAAASAPESELGSFRKRHISNCK